MSNVKHNVSSVAVNYQLSSNVLTFLVGYILNVQIFSVSKLKKWKQETKKTVYFPTFCIRLKNERLYFVIG